VGIRAYVGDQGQRRGELWATWASGQTLAKSKHRVIRANVWVNSG